MGRVWARENPVRRRGGVELGFGRAQERRKREGEETDAQDPVVSEEKRREGARAGVLTRGRAEWGKRRKGKGEKRKASRKGKFSFLFLI